MTHDILAIFIPGTPAAQGSMRALGAGVMVHSNAKTLKPWRLEVGWMAKEKWGDQPPLCGPVRVSMVFYFARPKSMKKAAPLAKFTRPDIDKLARAVLDALAGVCWHDDAQVAEMTACKLWLPPGGNSEPGLLLAVGAL